MRRSEDGTPVGSLDVNALSAEEKASFGIPADANRGTSEDRRDEEAAAADDGSEDLSKLRKDELVERASAAGLDTDGKTKAELVAELESQEVSDGNDSTP